jgi:hypothetical protein
VTKSGSNSLHGSVFEYLQNDALDASPYGFHGKASKRFNTFGDHWAVRSPSPTSNGRARTFFFFAYEGNRRRTSIAQQFLVPNARERAGDLSDMQSCNKRAGALPVR